MPIEPPPRVKIAVLMPTSWPSRSTSAPPELPGLIAASVWMNDRSGPMPGCGARERRDDAAGHGLADAERIADREHQIADLERIGIAERRVGRLRLGVDVQHREVGASSPPISTAANSRRSASTTVIWSASVDDVVVGDDQAVGAHDHARAQRILRPALQLALDRSAEEMAKEGVGGTGRRRAGPALRV